MTYSDIANALDNVIDLLRSAQIREAMRAIISLRDEVQR